MNEIREEIFDVMNNPKHMEKLSTIQGEANPQELRSQQGVETCSKIETASGLKTSHHLGTYGPDHPSAHRLDLCGGRRACFWKTAIYY